MWYIIGGVVLFLILSKSTSTSTNIYKPAIDSVVLNYSPAIGYVVQRWNVPYSLIVAMIVVESGGDRSAVGADNERGLMQITPDTFQSIVVQHFMSYSWDDMFQPAPNLDVCCAYLSDLYAQYKDWNLALRVYNDGPKSLVPGLTEKGLTYLNKVKSVQQYV